MQYHRHANAALWEACELVADMCISSADSLACWLILVFLIDYAHTIFFAYAWQAFAVMLSALALLTVLAVTCSAVLYVLWWFHFTIYPHVRRPVNPRLTQVPHQYLDTTAMTLPSKPDVIGQKAACLHPFART